MKSLRRIFSYIRSYKILIFVVLVLTTVFAGLDVYTTIFVEGFLDEALMSKDISMLVWITLQYIAAATGRELSEYCLDIVMGRLTGYFITDLRKDFYMKLSKFPYEYFNRVERSDIISRFVNDGERAKEALEQIFHSLYHGFSIVLFVAVMLSKNAKLTLGFLLVFPGMLFIIKFFSRRIIFTGKRIQEQLAIFVTTLNDFLAGIRVIKSFRSEKIEIKKFEINGKEYFKRHLNNVRVRAKFEFLEGWLMFLSLAAIAIFGGYEVINGNMTIGGFTFFFVALGEVHENISDFIEILGKVQTYLFASDRMFKVLDVKLVESEDKDLIRIPSIKGRVTFENVYFKYDKDSEYILKNINFDVEPGEVVAIIGKSGSGKTTLANLLLNLYRVNEGKIKIDNRIVTSLNKEDLSRQIGFVPQETFLFSDTISGNISYGTKATYDDVVRVTDQAFVSEFAEKMPDGLNSMINSEGSNLSGGQKQRIAIARAMIRDPKILVLDEATSALDTESERIVTQAISLAMENRTTFIITHKISSISKVDKIIVMNDGEISEMGSHEDLMEKNGMYSLWVKQQLIQGKKKWIKN